METIEVRCVDGETREVLRMWDDWELWRGWNERPTLWLDEEDR